ncbi:MAG: hypothetical protein IJ769_12765 [Clostridia bacterium]|nr:hypothetical protein [Clostridia bacterium]
MKIFSRDFTRTEKLLILVLVLILLALAYYQFVDQTVRTTVANAQSEAEMLELEISAAQARAARLRALRNTLDELEEKGQLSWMSSYNGSKAEVAFLNDILADTLTYSINFDKITRNGDQLRRSFKLRYQTGGFRLAREIMERLLAGENRCLVSDVKCTIADGGVTTIDAQATFYETMVGGTPDAGLPADAAAANR